MKLQVVVVREENLTSLRGFGFDERDASWEELVEAGCLYEVDLTYTPNHEETTLLAQGVLFRNQWSDDDIYYRWRLV